MDLDFLIFNLSFIFSQFFANVAKSYLFWNNHWTKELGKENWDAETST